MKRPIILFLFAAVCAFDQAFSQNCTALGQNPGTAFPVCGSKEFEQNTVPLCGGKKVPTPCNQPEIEDVNPFWYKFTCFTSGTLGFLITPDNLGDDYDWQLFDITGKNPEDVYTNKDLFVACSWSAHPGNTGATINGTGFVACINDTPEFTRMPNIIEGHQYLLLVSHFTQTQSGYRLSFNGGTADITDPTVPNLQAATGSCKGNEVYLKLNKSMKCSSLASDGSDFSVVSHSANVLRAVSASCVTGFNMDSIVVMFDRTLPMGSYTLQLQPGSDGNTLLDICDNEMAPATIDFTINEDVSAAFQYDIKTGCERDTIAFRHDGAHHVNSWNWAFDEGVSSNQSAEVIYHSSGTKTAHLTVSNGFCTDTASATMELSEKVNAAFQSPEIACAVDDVIITDASTGPITNWSWDLGFGQTVSQKNPSAFKYPRVSGEKNYRIVLTVSDATGCSDSASANIVVAGNCNIVVPTAFTPNRDGKNDELYPSNAFNADNLVFRVFNRFGQIVFESHDWKSRWDGNVNGQPQSSGTYVWTLSYVLKATGRHYSLKGTTVLIR